jgi:hypothetical protein
MAGGYVAHFGGGIHNIASPIVIEVDRTITGALGIDGGGARLISQIYDGSPLIEIHVAAGVDMRYLTLSNFIIQGNGNEGAGIRIVGRPSPMMPRASRRLPASIRSPTSGPATTQSISRTSRASTPTAASPGSRETSPDPAT